MLCFLVLYVVRPASRVFLTLLNRQQEGHPAVKSIGMLVVVMHILRVMVVTAATFVISHCGKIQNRLTVGAVLPRLPHKLADKTSVILLLYMLSVLLKS